MFLFIFCLCFHALAICKHKDRLPGHLRHYPGRYLNNLATNNAPKGVCGKDPPRKRASVEAGTPHRNQRDSSNHLSVERVDPTKVVIHRNDRPEHPPITPPLVVKKIPHWIQKCTGCSKDITSVITGYNHDEDSQYCLARHDAYYFWNKNASSQEHYTII